MSRVLSARLKEVITRHADDQTHIIYTHVLITIYPRQGHFAVSAGPCNASSLLTDFRCTELAR